MSLTVFTVFGRFFGLGFTQINKCRYKNKFKGTEQYLHVLIQIINDLNLIFSMKKIIQMFN